MAVQLERFRAGDVYIDYPYEEMMFHYVNETGKVFRKFYGDPEEDEISRSLDVYQDATSCGSEITPAQYAEGKPK